MKEAREQKPAVDKLNELSGSLLDLIPWHAREGLDKLVTEDGERYKAVCDAVTQQVERIDADLQRSQQVNRPRSAVRRLNLNLNWLVLKKEKKLNAFCRLPVRRGCRLRAGLAVRSREEIAVDGRHQAGAGSNHSPAPSAEG